jgi:uncharacterized protein with NRDE domain
MQRKDGYVLGVCLLIAEFRVSPDAPLAVAANRDERYGRPATAITVLRPEPPVILGGRDELAGGTWMAVNSGGLVAALTNLPSPAGRDPGRRSRGELPIALASQPDAAAAVAWLLDAVNPGDYNPCWLMIGDRSALYYADLTGGRRATVRPLPPGQYVLENAPLAPPSAKARHVAGLIDAARPPGRGGRGTGWAAGDLTTALAGVLRDHTPVPGDPGPGGEPGRLSAACVHGDGYGTRSAMIVAVPVTGLPRVQVADGPPCTTPLNDVSRLWPGNEI